jgi:ferredoxin
VPGIMKNESVWRMNHILWFLFLSVTTTDAFCYQKPLIRRGRDRPLFLSDWKDTSGEDSNQWSSSNDDNVGGGPGQQPDWEDVLSKKKDGSFWTSFEPSPEDDDDGDDEKDNKSEKIESSSSLEMDADMQGDSWLDQLAALSSEEVVFNLKEADRADKARQMQEWGFDNRIISSTLDVATDNSLEVAGEMEGMQAYREESYLDDEDIDFETVESHSRVEKDTETGEAIRTQMVYVDEHACIGCTNCATIAQSTFFMHQEHGRARVFSQWGDDEETIQIAIETCPVDCIHYIPYDELVTLEVERRDQNINFKAPKGESASGMSHRVGGANAFTAPQKISGNMGTRCSNCPSRGCKDCPMYGVGRNPEYEKKEKTRKERMAKFRLQKEREDKSAEL